ncbi:threonine/serine exporter family protein [Nonomuraea sp. NBC_01738]|uniref:threonine/serine ThrE exporter family protein n=1 Tax=Nonomuraea sp. NBC_01738 TaxID=2976003 RepID=UPI002E143773|nr:threonine/serine exporter family protein [Nonomuraea sp. NBC_01738]
MTSERIFLVDLARLMLTGSAEGVFMVRESVRRAGAAYGLEADLLVLPDQLVLTITDGEDTTTQVVEAVPGMSLDRMEAVKKLAVEVQAGLPLPDAIKRLAAIETAPPLYPRWLRVIGVTLFAAGFAPSLVPAWYELGTSLILGAVMGVLFVAFSGFRWEPLLPLIGSFVIACLTLTVFSDAAARSGPVMLMLPALFVLIPGDYLSAAAAELAVGRISAGATRLVWASFTLVQIIVGVELGAQLAGEGRQSLFEGSAPGTLPFWVIVAAWVPFTLGLAWTFNASLRNVPLMAALVIGTYLLYAGFARLAGDLIGTLVAGAALGVVGTLLARSPSMPPRLELVAGGFFTLTVGSLGLRGVTSILGGHPIVGVKDLADFMLIVPSVALGLLAGFLLVAPRAPATRAPGPRSG